jgi:hypothetical protein
MELSAVEISLVQVVTDFSHRLQNRVCQTSSSTKRHQQQTNDGCNTFSYKHHNDTTSLPTPPTPLTPTTLKTCMLSQQNESLFPPSSFPLATSLSTNELIFQEMSYKLHVIKEDVLKLEQTINQLQHQPSSFVNIGGGGRRQQQQPQQQMSTSLTTMTAAATTTTTTTTPPKAPSSAATAVEAAAVKVKAEFLQPKLATMNHSLLPSPPLLLSSSNVLNVSKVYDGVFKGEGRIKQKQFSQQIIGKEFTIDEKKEEEGEEDDGDEDNDDDYVDSCTAMNVDDESSHYQAFQGNDTFHCFTRSDYDEKEENYSSSNFGFGLIGEERQKKQQQDNNNLINNRYGQGPKNSSDTSTLMSMFNK